MSTICGVVGNPIEHSLSPMIHQIFAKEAKLDLRYDKILSDHNSFTKDIQHFFNNGGLGLNITVPFKTLAFSIAEKLSVDAKASGSVNTLFIDNQGSLCGDTTDGKGFLNDLFKKNIPYSSKRCLILGAGGAARSIVSALKNYTSSIFLLNRSELNAKKLIEDLQVASSVQLFSEENGTPFDLIINTMSEGAPFFMQKHAISPSDSFIYDISYGERASEFHSWCLQQGAFSYTDGWGMLVEQAALSFNLWHDFLPSTDIAPFY